MCPASIEYVAASMAGTRHEGKNDPRVGPARPVCAGEGAANNFLFFTRNTPHRPHGVAKNCPIATPCCAISPYMRFFPVTVRTLHATEALLERIYEASWNGARGDKLAAAVHMSVEDYQDLRALDPLVAQAELHGRADAEMALAKTLMTAAVSGDTKAAETMLRYTHAWTPPAQKVEIDVAQQISITTALAKAESRVLDLVEEVPSARTPVLSGTRDGTDGEALESRDQGRPRKVCPVGVPLG